MRVKRHNLTVAAAGTVSTSFQVEKDTVFTGALFPALVDGAVGVEASLDDSTFYPVLDPSDGQDVVIVASGSDPGWIDISDFIRFAHPGLYIRFTMAAQAGGASLVVFCRG